VFEVLTLEGSVNARDQSAATAPEAVLAAVNADRPALADKLQKGPCLAGLIWRSGLGLLPG